MDKSILYKLPKDILVELISTIQEETLKDPQKLIDHLINEHNIDIEYSKCDFCNKYEGKYGDSINFCDNCDKKCCFEHNKFKEAGFINYVYCIGCYTKYKNNLLFK